MSTINSTENTVRHKSLSFLGFHKYCVGDDGIVWSKCGRKWKSLKPRLCKANYLQVVLQSRGRKAYMVHHLVLRAFVGDCPDGLQGCHRNGNVQDNRLENVRWDTRQSNRRDGVVYCNPALMRKMKSEALSASVPSSRKSGFEAYLKLLEIHGDVEVWKDVDGFSGVYKVSSWGRVKSMSRKRFQRGGIYTIPERIIKASVNRKRYHKVVEFYKNGKVRSACIHRLVLEAFVGSCPKGMQCCHNDGNPSNNNLDNLRWDTPVNNQKDRFSHGTACFGETHKGAKIDEWTVREIRRIRAEEKVTHREIAVRLHITMRIVGCVLRGYCWSWVK